MSVLEQLEKPCFRPSKSDRIFMAYLKAHADDVPNTAIAVLAEASGVGEATITRFVRKMGYENLQALKVALAGELSERTKRYLVSSSIKDEESALVTGRKLLDADIGTLEKTLASLPEGCIEECAALILGAGRVCFVGLGNSGFMALDAAYKFTCIGLAAHGSNNTHMMMTLAALARPADVLVAVSHSGRSPEVVKTAEVVHSNGGRVIAVTSRQDSPLADEADCCAMYEAKEALLERGSISAKLGQAFIMDLIYTQIVKKMSSEATRCKKKTQDAVDLLR